MLIGKRDADDPVSVHHDRFHFLLIFFLTVTVTVTVTDNFLNEKSKSKKTLLKLEH